MIHLWQVLFNFLKFVRKGLFQLQFVGFEDIFIGSTPHPATVDKPITFHPKWGVCPTYCNKTRMHPENGQGNSHHWTNEKLVRWSSILKTWPVEHGFDGAGSQDLFNPDSAKNKKLDVWEPQDWREKNHWLLCEGLGLLVCFVWGLGCKVFSLPTKARYFQARQCNFHIFSDKYASMVDFDIVEQRVTYIGSP